MTFNLSNVQQHTVSLLGALVTSALFVAAAVAPAVQFI